MWLRTTTAEPSEHVLKCTFLGSLGGGQESAFSPRTAGFPHEAGTALQSPGPSDGTTRLLLPAWPLASFPTCGSPPWPPLRRPADSQPGRSSAQGVPLERGRSHQWRLEV